MDMSTKIGRLRCAFEAGEYLTPLRAWERWCMSSSTYHREIWELKHTHNMDIRSKIVTGENGIRHSVHRLERPELREAA